MLRKAPEVEVRGPALMSEQDQHSSDAAKAALQTQA